MSKSIGYAAALLCALGMASGNAVAGNSSLAPSTTFNCVFEEGVVAMNPNLVISDFAGGGKRHLISQAYLSSLKAPTNNIFQVLTLGKERLDRIWESSALDVKHVYGAGKIFGNAESHLLLAKQVGNSVLLQAMDETKMVKDLFSISGDVTGLAVADIDNDGVAEIIIGRTLQQYEEAAQGEIGIYRWNGKKFVDVWKIVPPSNKGAGMGSYPYFRVFDVDGDGLLDIVADEETQNFEPQIKVFAYDQSSKAFVQRLNQTYATLLNSNRTAVAGAISVGEERFLLIGRGEKVYVYSFKDSRLIRTLDIPAANITSGDIDNDGVEEILITSSQRISGKQSVSVFVLKKENLLAN